MWTRAGDLERNSHVAGENERGKRRGPLLYLDSMANVIQAAKVEGFPIVGREGR